VKQYGRHAEICHVSFSLTAVIQEEQHKYIKYLYLQAATKFLTLVAFDPMTLHVQAGYTNP
jgi:hypothetical protein